MYLYMPASAWNAVYVLVLMSKADSGLVFEMEVWAARGLVLCCSLVLPAASSLPLLLLLLLPPLLSCMRS